MPQSEVKEELRRFILELPFDDREQALYLQGLTSLSDAEAGEVLADFKASFANAQPALELAREILRKRAARKLPEECDCECHGNPNIRHVIACCSICDHCRRQIKFFELKVHAQKCASE